jgi:hypothetical protein
VEVEKLEELEESCASKAGGLTEGIVDFFAISAQDGFDG